MHARWRVLYLVPDLIGPPNGIARYCSMVQRALSDESAETVVIALHDRSDADPSVVRPARYIACNGSRAVFAAQALRHGLSLKPHAVLVGHPNFCSLGLALARATSAKLIVFTYGADIWVPLRPPRGWALRKADRVIAISRFTADKAATINGVSRSKLRVLFNCLDPAFSSDTKRVESGAGPSVLTVGRIGRLQGFKGHDVVMRAMPVLLERFPGLVYDIVGDGEARPQLEALARDLDVASAVRFHGIVSDEELSAIYGRASVMVMPSAREGFGFVFLEAMAHGTPVIGGDRDATPEVILDGETGFVVDPTSVAEVTAAIARVLEDAPLQSRMSAAGRQRANEKFGFAQFRSQVMSYIAEVLS